MKRDWPMAAMLAMLMVIGWSITVNWIYDHQPKPASYYYMHCHFDDDRHTVPCRITNVHLFWPWSELKSGPK
jgi:hypothetical protein